MDALTTLVYWLYLLSLALWVGSLALLVGVLRPRTLSSWGGHVYPGDRHALHRARSHAARIGRGATVVLIVTLFSDVIVRALAAGDLGAAFSTLHALLFESRYGQTTVIRWLLVIGGFFVMGELLHAQESPPSPQSSDVGPPQRARRWDETTWLCAACALVVLLILCTAAAGDYGTTVALGITEAIHLIATLLWLGGLIVLALVIPTLLGDIERLRQPHTILAILRSFTPIAVLGFAVFIVTGLVEVRTAGPLPTDPAARPALTLRTLFIVAIIAVSLCSVSFLHPRLRRLSLRALRDHRVSPTLDRALHDTRRPTVLNAVLAGLALLCGAVANVVPLAATAVAGPALTAVGHAGNLAVTLHVTPTNDAMDAVTIGLTDAHGAPLRNASVLITTPGAPCAGGPALTAHNVGDGDYRASGIAPGSGQWDMRVSVRTTSLMSSVLFRLTDATASSRPTGSTTPALLGIKGWQSIGPAVVVHTLLVQDAAHLYEGTSDGVYRSTDSGGHWSAASVGLRSTSRSVWALSLLPDGSLIAGTSDGAYRSTDGRTWHAAGLLDRPVYTIASHSAGHVILLAGAVGGIFRSDDLGASWHVSLNTGSRIVTSLAWPALRPELILATLTPGPQALVMSHDGGATWDAMMQGLPASAGSMSVAIAPDLQEAYVGTMGLGIYTSSGPSASWRSASRGLPGLSSGNAHVGAFAFDPRGAVYAATDFGVFRRSDNAADWAPLGGLSCDASLVSSVAVVPNTHPVVYAATASGLFRRTM